MRHVIRIYTKRGLTVHFNVFYNCVVTWANFENLRRQNVDFFKGSRFRLRNKVTPVDRYDHMQSLQGDHRARGSKIKRSELEQLSTVHSLGSLNGHYIWRCCPCQVCRLCWWPLLSWPPDCCLFYRALTPCYSSEWTPLTTRTGTTLKIWADALKQVSTPRHTDRQSWRHLDCHIHTCLLLFIHIYIYI